MASESPLNQHDERLAELVQDGTPSPAAPTPVAAPLDPAQQSLADALRVMFFVLKLVMVVVVVAFIFSGCYSVESQNVAVRLLFGRIVGETPKQQVVEAGGPYFAAPYPIMQVVMVPITNRTVNIDKAFWLNIPENATGQTLAEQAMRAGSLDPEKDGSLLTGDANIVHARWAMNYRVSDPVQFIRRVGDPSSPEKLAAAGDDLVEVVAEQAIVHTLASLTADRIQKGLSTVEFAAVRQHMQRALDNLESGITVETVSATKTVFPVSVHKAFQAVIKAENEKAREIEDAQKERSTTLGEAAGEAYEPLLALIESYEQATLSKDKSREDAVSAEMDQAFETLEVPWQGRQVAIGGRVAELIDGAKVYRTQVVRNTQAQADYFLQLKKQYDENPRIVLQRLWQDAVQQAMGKDVETLFVPADWQLYTEFNRDPEIWREREQKRLEAQKATLAP